MISSKNYNALKIITLIRDLECNKTPSNLDCRPYFLCSLILDIKLFRIGWKRRWRMISWSQQISPTWYYQHSLIRDTTRNSPRVEGLKGSGRSKGEVKYSSVMRGYSGLLPSTLSVEKYGLLERKERLERRETEILLLHLLDFISKWY